MKKLYNLPNDKETEKCIKKLSKKLWNKENIDSPLEEGWFCQYCEKIIQPEEENGSIFEIYQLNFFLTASFHFLKNRSY